jgi:hypothetical protein
MLIKAMLEPFYSYNYAQLCKVLCKIKVPLEDDKSINNFITFRSLLFTKCQQEYENDYLKDDSEEIVEMDNKKKRWLANIRLIGELYKLASQPDTLNIIEIINNLLNKSTSGNQIDDDCLKCLVRLLKSIGPLIDKANNNAKQKLAINSIFNNLKVIIDNQTSNGLKNNTKFMILNILEMRQVIKN